MNTRSTKQASESGSVLIVIMGVLAVAALVLGSYFMLVQNQSASVARSQAWNSVIPVTEAGVEEGMQLVNKDAGVYGATQWDWTNTLAANGWSAFSSNVTTLTRTFSDGSSYTVSIDITPAASGLGPAIYSVGNVPYTTYAFFGMLHPFFAAQGVAGQSNTTTASTSMGRKVNVATVPIPLFSAAIVTKSNVDMKGNNVLVDSFDSSTTNYSVNGIYNVLKRKANGDVATDSSIVNTLNIGNANIYGHVMTGPGTLASAVQVGSQGAVGNAVWNANPANRGKVQPGYWDGDFNIDMPDVQQPTWAGGALPSASNGVITVSGGQFTSGGDPTADLVITGPTTLWVQGSFSRNVSIATTNNASLVLYVGTTNAAGDDSIDYSGHGNINYPGLGEKFQIFGLPSLQTIDFTGNSGFAGTIYAPSAHLRGGGSGNNDLDTSGSVIVESITLNGHWNFHYDEHLKVSGPSRGWIAKSWAEQRASN